MKISLKTADPAGHKTPALIVFLFAEDKADLKERPELAGLRKLIGPKLESKDYRAKHLSLLTLYPDVKGGPERVILMGLGKVKEYDVNKLREAAAKAVKAARGKHLQNAAMLLPPGRANLTGEETVAEVCALGALLGLYSFKELKSKKDDEETSPKPFRSLTLLRAVEGVKASKIQAGIRAAEVTAEAVSRVRDLGNRPGNLVYPETLAEEAKKIADEHGLKLTVLNMEQALKRKMGAFYAVAKGSVRPGRVIILEYRGADAKSKPVALVGKAITFDSGGLSLKQPEGMGTMKTDMAGGAVVLSVVAAAAKLKLKVNIVGVVPAAENMPDGNAYRPGDVLTSMSGKTIEVISTDAEGRLVLSDALTLAQEYGPRAVIDLATLTGACLVALGEKCAGLMGNDQDLIEAVKAAGAAVGERVWQLPLFEEYFEKIKSDTADIKNAGGRNAGTITAGLFLKQFIDEKTRWAHIDIAGPARTDQAAPDTPVGATGFGVGLLLNYLRNQ